MKTRLYYIRTVWWQIHKRRRWIVRRAIRILFLLSGIMFLLLLGLAAVDGNPARPAYFLVLLIPLALAIFTSLLQLLQAIRATRADRLKTTTGYLVDGSTIFEQADDRIKKLLAADIQLETGTSEDHEVAYAMTPATALDGSHFFGIIAPDYYLSQAEIVSNEKNILLDTYATDCTFFFIYSEQLAQKAKNLAVQRVFTKNTVYTVSQAPVTALFTTVKNIDHVLLEIQPV